MAPDESNRAAQGERPPDTAPRPGGGPSSEVRADRQHLRELQRARWLRLAKVLVALAIVVSFIIFVIQNSQAVPVDFVFLTSYPRLIWVMVACALLGGVVGYLIGKPPRNLRLHRRSGDE